MNVVSNWQRDNWYKELVRLGEDAGLSDATAPRIVVLLRDDLLPPLHQGIQAAHACISLSNWIELDPRSYLILLGASYEEMNKLAKKTKLVHAKYTDPGLVEPETGKPLMTAVAFEPISKEQVKKYFGHLSRAK